MAALCGDRDRLIAGTCSAIAAVGAGDSSVTTMKSCRRNSALYRGSSCVFDGLFKNAICVQGVAAHVRPTRREMSGQRARVSETLTEIRERLSPGQLLDEALRRSGTREAIRGSGR
jgi:hypothetical protein